MAEVLGTVGSIVGIADFGLKFAATLQAYIVSVADAQQSLQDIVSDVNATASALQQLFDILKTDENGKAIANEKGRAHIIQQASRCKRVYIELYDIAAKAADIPVQKDDNGDISLDALNMNNPQKLKWPFRETRIKKCQDDIKGLKIDLIFHLQLMEVAKAKMVTSNTSQTMADLKAALERFHAYQKLYRSEIAALKRNQKKREARKKKKAFRRASPGASSEVRLSESPSSAPASPVIETPRPADNQSIQELPISTLSKSPENSSPLPLCADSFEPEAFISNVLPPEVDPGSSNAIEDFKPHLPFLNMLTIPLANGSSDIPLPEQGHVEKYPMVDKPPTQPPEPVIMPNPTTSRQPVGHSTSLTNTREEAPDPNIAPDLSKGKQRLGSSWRSRITFCGILFRRRDISTREWETMELEAYLIEDSSGVIRKVPLGHRELLRVLRRPLKSKKDVWTQYISLTPAQREGVDKAIREARHSSPHERTCVAISTQSKRSSTITVYLSVGALVQPIHLRTDGLYFQFPFELCRTWEDVNELIKEAFTHTNGIDIHLQQRIQQGNYRLKGPLDNIILPRAWINTAKPGLDIYLDHTSFGLHDAAFSTEVVESVKKKSKKNKKKSQANVEKEVVIPVDGFQDILPSAQEEEQWSTPKKSKKGKKRSQAWVEETNTASEYIQEDGADTTIHTPNVEEEPNRIDAQSGSRPRKASWELLARAIVGETGEKLDTSIRYSGEHAASPARRPSPTIVGVPRSSSEVATVNPDVVDDFTFTATVAAGLEATGFDPNVVIDDESDGYSDIIDFEEEEEDANLGINDLLGKWTNALDGTSS